MRIVTYDETTALKDYFNYFFNVQKLGLVAAVTPRDRYALKSGVGKSYTALEIGVMLDPNFDQDNIIFTPRDFVIAMRKVEDIGKSGQVVVIDEAGIMVNARRWNSLVNKGVADAIMTFRNLQSLALFVTPKVTILDKYIRLYVSHLIQVDKIVTAGRNIKVIAKFYRISWNDDMRGYYRRNITMYSKKHKGLIKLKGFQVKMIPDYIRKPYEKRMKEYKAKVRASIANMEDDDKPIQYYVDNFLDVVGEDVEFNKRMGRKHIYPTDIKERYNLSVRKSNSVARKVNDIFAKGESIQYESTEPTKPTGIIRV